MTTLLKNVTNSIWHAFRALQQDCSGFVGKSKLKVSGGSNYFDNKKLNIFVFVIALLLKWSPSHPATFEGMQKR